MIEASNKGGLNAQIETVEKMVEVVELKPVAAAPAENARGSKTPQEVIAELRAKRSLGIKPEEKVEVKTLNELMVERKQRNEEAYCDALRAEGKPIYTLADVMAIGYKPDTSWNQEDLQSRMLYGPVLLPLKQLQKRADDHHQTFVIPGRKAVMEIMVEVYHLFLLAMVQERRDAVFKTIKENVEARLGRKLSEDTSFGSIFVRFVFTEFDDRKVHLYSRALDFAFGSNVSADTFKAWVERFGGWEKVRQEAAKASNSHPDVLIARKAKEVAESDALSLVERWKILRGVLGTVDISGQLSKKLGNKPGHFLLEVTWMPEHQPSVDVFGGHIEVTDILPNSEVIHHAVHQMRVEAAKLERDALVEIVERLDAEAYDALDEETKARYDNLESVRATCLARNEANVAVAKAKQASEITPKSFA